MTRTRFASISAIVLVSSVLLGLSLHAAGPGTPSDAGADFAGKILVLCTKSSAEYGATLESVSLKRIGGRDFFVGKWTTNDGLPTWQSGQTVWYPVDGASEVVLFDNLEQFKKAFANRRQ